MLKANNLLFSEINVGDVHQFTKIITQLDVMGFAKLTGDYNPLHVDSEFGKESQFKENIVHGMLLGGLFSTIVGMYCPGKNSLYLAQTLKFKLPVFYGDEIIVKGTVIDKNESIKLIALKTEIFKKDTVVISGEAKIKFMGDNSE